MPAEVDSTRPEQRALEAACLLPPGGAVTGWAALRLAGAAYFDGRANGATDTRPVTLAPGSRRGMRAHEAVAWSYEAFAPEEVVVLQGVPCLPPARALVDELRSLPDARERVVAVDMAVAARVTSLRRVTAYVDARRLRRSDLVRAAVALGREGVRSPPESWLRLVWTLDAGFPEPWVNREVETIGGELVCVPDLFDEEAGLVLEYDGEDHRTLHRHDHDVRRQDRCRRVDLEYVTVTARDRHRVPALLDRLRSARGRARFALPPERAWRLRPDCSPSVDDLLDERAWRSAELWRSHGIRVTPW